MLVYKTFNDRLPPEEWLKIKVLEINTTIQTCFMTRKVKKPKIDMKCLSTRFHSLKRKPL
jgi:hypothetical protein